MRALSKLTLVSIFFLSSACSRGVSILRSADSGRDSGMDAALDAWALDSFVDIGPLDVGQMLDVQTTDALSEDAKVDALDSFVPCQSNCPQIVAVEGGNDFTCALKNDGTVWCWGNNSESQLGSGDNINRARPNQVVDLDRVQKLSVGAQHACALIEGGTVKCWGNNYFGQLGDGETGNSNRPVPVRNLTEVYRLSGGGHANCVIRDDESVHCWGFNGYQNLGIASTEMNQPLVQPVTVVSDATLIAVAPRYTCALRWNGKVYCWGRNEHGMLGNGSTQQSATAVQVSQLSATDLAVSRQNSWGHSCALNSQGAIQCWGDNESSQIAPRNFAYETTPRAVSGSIATLQLSLGESFSCALSSGQEVFCWGQNLFGQLGRDTNGEDDGNALPVTELNASSAARSARAIGAGKEHACAILMDGTSVLCWGRNNYGQLGNDTVQDQPNPVRVLF